MYSPLDAHLTLSPSLAGRLSVVIVGSAVGSVSGLIQGLAVLGNQTVDLPHVGALVVGGFQGASVMTGRHGASVATGRHGASVTAGHGASFLLGAVVQTGCSRLRFHPLADVVAGILPINRRLTNETKGYGP